MRSSEKGQGRQEGDRQQENSSEESNEKKESTSPLEWAVAAISAVLIFSAMGYLVYDARSNESLLPHIEVQVDAVRNVGTGYVVEFSANNHGRTAANLLIEGSLLNDSGTVETSSVTIDYVPSEATRQAYLFFSHNPDRYDLEIGPKGSDRP